MLPHVTLFNAMSLDGRLDHLETYEHIYNLYYGLASQWPIDAVLMGSSTILKGFDAQEGEIRGDINQVRQNREKISPDPRPWLLVPDSGGKIGVWAEVLGMPYIKDVLVLCSHSTPPKYLDFLTDNHMEHIIVGEDQVDLKKALMNLKENYGIEKIRVDSGGTLNGALLRARLVDDIRVLINPSLTGGVSASSIFQAADLKDSEDVIDLKLTCLKRMEGDLVYLQYEIEK